jgi:zinc-ribbon domain
MVDPARSGERSMTVVCSWCSTEVADGTATCPNCGANLVPDGDPNVPGVTAVDAASIIRSKTAPPQRSRLLSWISGEYETDIPSKAEQQAIAPPDLEVRREIFRLELEAEVANLQAEADALRAEAVAEGRTIDYPADVDPNAPDADATDADGADADEADADATAAGAPIAEASTDAAPVEASETEDKPAG